MIRKGPSGRANRLTKMIVTASAVNSIVRRLAGMPQDAQVIEYERRATSDTVGGASLEATVEVRFHLEW